MKKNTKILLLLALILCALLAYFLLPKAGGNTPSAGNNTADNSNNTNGSNASSGSGSNSSGNSSSQEKEGSSPSEATIQEDQGDIIITIPDDQQSGGE